MRFVIRHTDRPIKYRSFASSFEYRKQHVAKNAIIFYVQEMKLRRDDLVARICQPL